MKYILTGSVGNIGKPLAIQLVAAGHDVTVISSNPDKKPEIEQLGAKATIGNILDTDFLKNNFTGADAVYLMIPPNFGVDDWIVYQKEVADNYVKALRSAGVKKVVQLSSIGAHRGQGCGPIDGVAYLEQQLSKLENVDVKSLRPAYFYTNFYTMETLIQQAGIMGSNFGTADEKFPMVHPSDIAAEAAHYLQNLSFKGHTHVYISSDLRSFAEMGQVFAKALGKPDLQWVAFSDDDTYNAMLQSGLKPTFAEGFVQMGKSFRSGVAHEDYFASGAKPQGKIKLEDFAAEFARLF